MPHQTLDNRISCLKAVSAVAEAIYPANFDHFIIFGLPDDGVILAFVGSLQVEATTFLTAYNLVCTKQVPAVKPGCWLPFCMT
ncbi:hypothetical protein [Serratia symbiotica]|uniref:hypothetical protein n=1 Tax=Serratia symbiotica TaxID=138074 RepID=UPI0030CA88E5